MAGYVVPAVWSMIAGAWLAVGAFHFTAALRPPRHRARLAFAALAVCAVVIALFELLLIHAQGESQRAAIARWNRVPLFVMVALLVVFVRLYFRAGRAWLAGATCGAAFVALVWGFSPTDSESMEGANPWSRIGEATPLLLLAYVADAARTCWRSGESNERRRAVLGGGSLVLAIVLVWLDNTLLHASVVEAAYLYAFISATVVAALGSKLGARWITTQDRFRLVLEAASNGLMMVDGAGRIAMSNTRAARIFGYAPDELARLTIGSLLPGVPFEGRRGHRLLAVQGGEVSGIRSDGSTVPLDLSVTSIEVNEGNASLVSIVDLTERKRAEDLVRRERAFLRQVIDIDPNLIFAKDRSGRFTLANKATAQVYGTTVENLIGRTDDDFNPNAAEVAAFRRDDLKVMDTRSELFIAEERITDKSGKIRYMQTVKRPILGEDGAASQVLGVAADITARKEAELQLGVQRNQLAHLSRVTMLAELSGSMAHELNQPLTAILSNAQAALRFLEAGKASPEELREILQDIVSDDKRAGHVIQGLRLLLTKGEMRREALDINAVVNDVLRILHSDLLHLGVSVIVELQEGLPRVMGDQVQLQQVMLNLIVNGCDAMAGLTERRELLVSTAPSEGLVYVCVGDRGHGIAPEHAEKIFQPFFTTKDHGFGMGLSICRNIVTTHGGRLWCADRDGGGAKFCFTLPAQSEGRA